MNQIEKEFAAFYTNQLNTNVQLPPYITDKFYIENCLHLSDNKEIYLLRDIQSGKKYILKLTPKEFIYRSEAEREILSCLDNLSFPKVHSWHEDNSFTYLIREFFDGVTLESLVENEKILPDCEIINIGLQICDVLSYLHNHCPPIIHRDIKPQNIILKPGGGIGLIDFDTARRYDANSTRDTVFLGTMQTAAPEQFGYSQTNQHTDIYALGILLIYMATGSYDKSGLESMSPLLRKIAGKCTEFSPKDRFQTVAALKKSLLNKRSSLSSNKLAMLIIIFIFFATIATISFYISVHFNTNLSTSTNSSPYSETDTNLNSAEITSLNTEADSGLYSVPSSNTHEETDLDLISAESDSTNQEHTVAFNTEVSVSTSPNVGEGSDPDTSHDTHKDNNVTLNTQMSSNINISEDHIVQEKSITFESPAIEKAVREILDKNNSEAISSQELGQITKLNFIGNLPVSSDRHAIQHDFFGNRIKYDDKEVMRGTVDTLADLKKFPFLTSVTLIYQQINDLSGIEDLNHLQELFVGYNSISDLTPLRDMDSIRFLSVLCNPVKDLSPLESLSHLWYLQIAGTNVTDLTPLISINALEELDIWDMGELDLTPLDKMKNLKKVYKYQP